MSKLSWAFITLLITAAIAVPMLIYATLHNENEYIKQCHVQGYVVVETPKGVECIEAPKVDITPSR